MIKIENLEEKKYWIWITLIQNLGAKKIQKLLKKFKTPEKIFKATEKELILTEGIGEKTAQLISEQKKVINIEKHMIYMEKNNINIITINEQEYPQNLKNIYDPPVCLYLRGNKKILNNLNIGIVGCRKYSEYGKKCAQYFSYELAKQKINIVSGLAKGIDSFSHIGAILAKGKTIAVVGNGLDTIYPKENKILAEKIIQTGGTIISEYPLGTKPEKKNFPARNRVISGISESIIVVEATPKSGSIITVDFALEQGREVFAVPGNINSINSVGTNELLKHGAQIATNYKDIMYNLKI